MNHRNNLLQFLGELAARNVDIRHRTTDRESRRYFQWGSQETALLGTYALNNKGWNLLVDMLPGGNLDNKRDYEQRHFRVALHFVRHTDAQDFDAVNQTIGESWELGWEYLNRTRECIQRRCDAEINDTATIPRNMPWERIKHQEVAPLIFIGDSHYGYRFEVEFTYDQDIPYTSDPAKWGDPT